MKKTFLFLFFFSLMHFAYAMKMLSIYTSESPVINQSEVQRDLAVQRAFSETLIKVSGNPSVLYSPVIKAALSKAKNYIQEYSYSPLSGETAPFLLKVEFDPKAIQKLLSEAKISAWDENRPLIVAWLVVDFSQKNTPELLDNASINELATILKARSKYRGVPILLPIMDIADLNQASISDVQAMLLAPLQKASERYHAEGILLGNVHLDNKKMQGHWKLVIGQEQWEWDINDDSASVMIESLIDKIIDVINNHQKTVFNKKEFSSITIVVKGVTGQDDLNSLLHFLRHAPIIKKLTIENVSNDQVLLDLAVDGTKQAFIQEMALSQNLKLQLDEENNLTYLWIK